MTARVVRPCRAVRVGAGIIAAALLLAGCASTPSPGQSPSDIDVQRGIVYRDIDGSELKLDACLPGDDGPHPAIVVVHGGAFEAGDRSTMTGVCELLAEQGYAAFAVDYRLVPSTYPAQVEDVSAAVDWLRAPEQVEEFSLDGSMALVGSSAGAIIALSTAADLSQAGTPVDAVVALSAAGDLTADAAAAVPDERLEKVVLAYLGCASVEDCGVAAEASPVTVAADLPPTLLIHGSDELIPIAQAEQLAAAMESAGVEHELVIVDGARHGLQLLNSKTRPAIFDFLDANSP